MKAKYVVTTHDDLRRLCIRKGWFRDGSNEQYEKLFDANENGGFSVRDIATIIWTCSEAKLEEIEKALEEEHEDYLEMLALIKCSERERAADEIYCSYFE